MIFTFESGDLKYYISMSLAFLRAIMQTWFLSLEGCGCSVRVHKC